jgi:hypothetical protein
MSLARGELPALVRDPHRVPERGAVDEARGDGLFVAQGAAQLAEHAARLVDVDVLADERRALAVVAALAALRHGADAAAQEVQVEPWQFPDGESHPAHFVVLNAVPALPPCFSCACNGYVSGKRARGLATGVQGGGESALTRYH